MKCLFWVILLPLFLSGSPVMDLGVERLYVGFQPVSNSTTVCKLVLQLRVLNKGDVESPVCDLEFFASPVRDDKSFPSRRRNEVPSLAAGESIDFKREWRVDKKQADQICKELCCGMMLVKATLVPRDSVMDNNSKNDVIVSALLGKAPDNNGEISNLDSVFVKMQPEDKVEILKELKGYDSLIIRMIKVGNSGCWLNHEDGYSSIVHMNNK